MKILSKHKDYYDYLTGIHGIDPVLVYDRRLFPVENFEKYHTHDPQTLSLHHEFNIHVNNKSYLVFLREGKLYHSEKEILELFKIYREFGRSHFGSSLFNGNFRYAQGVSLIPSKYNFRAKINLSLKKNVTAEVNLSEC